MRWRDYAVVKLYGSEEQVVRRRRDMGGEGHVVVRCSGEILGW